MTGRRRGWIARLRPQDEAAFGRAASPAEVVRDAVARLGEGPTHWAIELNSVVVGRIVAEVPALGGTPAAVEILRRGNEATTLRALSTLTDGPAAATPVDEVTLASIRELVHRSVPLEQVLR